MPVLRVRPLLEKAKQEEAGILVDQIRLFTLVRKEQGVNSYLKTKEMVCYNWRVS